MATDAHTSLLTFYKSDGVTPLGNGNTSQSGKEADSLSDIMTTGEDVLSLRREMYQAPGGDETEETAFESGILEVLGPHAKRQRLDPTSVTLGQATGSALDDVPQERCLNSEEPLVLHTDSNNDTLNIANNLPNLQTNDNPCVTADDNCDVGQLSDIAVPAGRVDRVTT